ncbi:uncharacterized protein ACNLHF_023741 isoform 2-T2 [Anomaloglossus baeobatrachus]|uniref:uncharacterized protein LOC142243230 isoform X2 n=1 Tax=Anomaloglossus baeobatrachus TaxID=238106 RepID=UPI003F4FE51E
MQNNSSGSQNALAGANQNPDQKVKPKFKCKDCDFNCSSLQNFRIHLQMAHQTVNETAEKLSALKKAVEEIKRVQPVRNFYEVQQMQNAKPAVNVRPGPVNMAPTISKPFAPNGPVNMAPTISKPFVPNVPNARMMFPAGNVRDANQVIPAGNVQQDALQMTFAKQKTFIPAVIKRTNPGKNLQTGILQSSFGKKTSFMPEVKKNPPEKYQPATGKNNPPEKLQPEKPKEKPAASAHREVTTEGSGREIAKLSDYISRRDREPLIGLEYVLEYQIRMPKNQIVHKYFCELCECDIELDPMVEHLAGFGHRKLYLAKEYPYVLKAQSNSKEEASKFIRRMALEIEREEGTKMYLVDSSIWSETMMTLRKADKKMRKKSRWDDDKNDDSRMKKALKYLESFEIDNELESTTVTRLCEKLTANLKSYTIKANQDALFPARVARAQNVAWSMMKNAEKQRKQTQYANMMNSQQNKAHAGNANLEQLGTRSGFPENKNQHIAEIQNMVKPPPYQQAPQNAFNPSMGAPQYMPRPPLHQQANPNAFVPPMNATQNMPTAQQPPVQVAWKKSFVPLNKDSSMSRGNETSQFDESVLKNISQDDSQFFKKLVTLLDVLPQKNSPSEGAQMNSKLQMLKSLFVSQKHEEQEQANQKLMTQIASMVKDTISAQNANLNQQLMRLVGSQNSTAMAMQTASLKNNLMARGQLNDNSLSTAGLVSGMQSAGNMQMNMNSMMPYQNFGNQGYGQMGEMANNQMNPNAYQVPPAEMQSYPSTSQAPNYGYGNSVSDSYTSQRDGMQGEQTRTPYSNVGNKPSMYDKPWDASYDNLSRSLEPQYDDLKEKPYTRVCLSPNSKQTLRDDYYDNTRREMGMQDSRPHTSIRSYASDWDDQEGDMSYFKRARLDMDIQSNRSEHSNDESLGINTAGMPEQLVKRIRGKDLFTASAIISEYSERYSGK